MELLFWKNELAEKVNRWEPTRSNTGAAWDVIARWEDSGTMGVEGSKG
jgi:hypothetical protein